MWKEEARVLMAFPDMWSERELKERPSKTVLGTGWIHFIRPAMRSVRVYEP